MKPVNKLVRLHSPDIPMLTIEDLDEHAEFRDLPLDKKDELISLVNCLAVALYHSYYNSNERQH